ncbi:pilus assembly protein FimV [Janthinobacterium sp. SUN073]|uniref:FimV/HubP family polar landmark protein n=1 Tax=Janthinobacterium sp. SUN073 TaxID=3004102 RepID=UPI0025B1E311|nr:FimV/HubP family polar landmark protein [Janthinobacterium sp. SUN073]MDN2695171.1 pilus assembly protein FimV [Janthinobacterium sp. SUN073]
MLLSPAVSAAELGKITVLSAAGQPLRAEVELSAVKPGEASSLLAKLAPPDAYRQANVEFNPALNALTFAVESRNGKSFIRISSAQAVAEPMVDLLLELSSKSGRQVREYAFVLDTPEARQTRGAQVTAPAEPGRAGRNVEPTAAQESRKKPAGEYKVKAGDTLSRIASELKPSGVSLDMMLVALYRANPDAFRGENMNRMQAGRILAVPGADAVRATDAAEAKGVVTAHAIDFEAYRNKLAGQVSQSKPAKAAQATQSTAGKIGATKVQEKPTAVSESQDKLKLSKAEPAAKSAGKSAIASEEDKIAKAKQVDEAAARVKELEKNVSDLEKLMAVKSKAMADKSAPAPAKPAEAAASASANSPASAIASAPAEALPPVPKAKPVPLVKKPSPLEPTITDKISDHLGAIGIGLAALLAAVAALVIARRRKDAPPAPESVAPVLEPEAPVTPPSGLAPEDQQSEASNHLFGTGAAAAGVAAAAGASMLEGNETDPVAEADVYIAYGRDGQAEDILKEALRIHPERHAARLKLLEIYSARNDVRAFEDQASELYSLTRGQGEEWPQAAALGMALDPTNPLYGDTEDDAVVSLSKGAGDDLHGQSMDLPDEPSMPLADLAPVEPVSSVAARDARDPLDFDLDSLDFEPVSTSDPIVMPGPDSKPQSTTQEAQYDASMDFGLDLEPPAGPVNGVGAGLTPLPDPLKDVDLAHFDLDEPVAPAAAPMAATESSIDSLFDDAQTPATLPEAIPPAQEFDLSGIDLDLNDGKTASVGVDDPLSAIHMEMDTKLDLAIAYQEIGDKEGARELIDEVIKGGSEEQVAKANTMKALLS